MKYNRGGKTLKAGDIGRMSVLRQHLLLPGERFKPSVQGNVRLSGLRQQTSVYLNANIEAFVAPLRWYFPDFPEYLQDGYLTSKVIPTIALGAPWNAPSDITSQLGVGKITAPFCKWFAQHPINVWNEWYKHPDGTTQSVTTPLASFYDNFGQPVTNMPTATTRIRDSSVADAEVPAVTEVNLRDFARRQAIFQQEVVKEYKSGTGTEERYNRFMSSIMNAKGNNEVDQIPTRLKSGASLSVKPHDMYASDGASLGEIMSISNFQVDHKWDSFQAQEHMIVCYIMTLKFSPISDSGVLPALYPADTAYDIYQGDPNILANSTVVGVKRREVMDGDATILGGLPAGWQLREGSNHVDKIVADLQNFPLLKNTVETADGLRDASNISDAFRSLALRHWFADLDFSIPVNSSIPSAGQSITSGADGGTRTLKGNYPDGGANL